MLSFCLQLFWLLVNTHSYKIVSSQIKLLFYYFIYYYYYYFYYYYFIIMIIIIINEKKRQYSSRVLDIEHGTFTPLIFTTTGGMGKECLNYHSRLAELIAIKKGEDYAKTISWIRARTSFALLSSALICLRGTRSTIRKSWDFRNTDIEIENIEGAIYWVFFFLNGHLLFFFFFNTHFK